MNASNPYAPPRSAVQDITDPTALPEPADRGTRLVAHILDAIIVAGMVYVPLLMAGAIAGTAGGVRDEVLDGVVVGSILGGVALVGFVVWCWLTVQYVARNGQSIAKKLLGIKVVRSDGSRASIARIFWLRNVVNTLLSVVPLYGVVDALFIFGEPRQCVHDKLADTIVVKA